MIADIIGPEGVLRTVAGLVGSGRRPGWRPGRRRRADEAIRLGTQLPLTRFQHVLGVIPRASATSALVGARQTSCTRRSVVRSRAAGRDRQGAAAPSRTLPGQREDERARQVRGSELALPCYPSGPSFVRLLGRTHNSVRSDRTNPRRLQRPWAACYGRSMNVSPRLRHTCIRPVGLSWRAERVSR